MPTRQRRKTARTPTDVLIAASRRWRVPLWALLGVKLSETGSDPNAANPFQFEPGAAAQAGVRDVNNFEESANGAAKLLASYKRQFGSWNAAFEAYNGGPGAVGKGYAYNEAHVKGKLREFGVGGLASNRRLVGFGDLIENLSPNLKKDVEELLGPEGPPGAATSPGGHGPGIGPGGTSGNILGLESIGQVLSALVDIQTWLRVLEIIGGAALLYLGLKTLTGIELPTPNVVPVPV